MTIDQISKDVEYLLDELNENYDPICLPDRNISCQDILTNVLRQLKELNPTHDAAASSTPGLFDEIKPQRSIHRPHPGVTFQRGKWKAEIGYQAKMNYLGTYINLADAIAARKKAEAIIEIDRQKKKLTQFAAKITQ